MTSTSVVTDGVPILHDHVLARGTDDAMMIEDATDREVMTEARIKTEDLEGIDHDRMAGAEITGLEVGHLTSVGTEEVGAEIEAEIGQSQGDRHNLRPPHLGHVASNIATAQRAEPHSTHWVTQIRRVDVRKKLTCQHAVLLRLNSPESM